MDMAARTGAWSPSGAPLPYDEEVEYLESTGTQWIDSGIKPGPITRVEAIFAMTTFTDNCGLFGARGFISNAVSFYNLFIINNTGYRVRWDWSGSGNYKTSEVDTSTAATYILGAAGGDITRNGVSLMPVSETKATLNHPLYIFNFNNNGAPYLQGANAKFWLVKIYDGKTLVFDAIPVRVGKFGYLYDRVSDRLLGNAGTGDFIIGPDKTT